MRLTMMFPVATATLALCCACSSGSPQSALDAYADAVERNDAAAAYALLDDAFHERVDRETFDKRFAEQQNAREEIVASLEQAADGPTYVDARLAYTEFDTLELALTPDAWKFEAGLFNFYGQRTPREALHSFIKALERRKYDILMRFIPADYAEHMNAEQIKIQFEANPARIEEMIALLRQHKDDLIQRQGKQAFMEYGAYRIDFVQQDGLWMVEDPD